MSGYSSAALQGARAHVMCGDCRLLCVTMTRWVVLARFRSYVGLLMNSYCHADAAEQTQWFGDDIAFKRDGVEILGMGTVQAVAFLLRAAETHDRVPDERLDVGGPVRAKAGIRRRGVFGHRPDLPVLGRLGAAVSAARLTDLSGHWRRAPSGCVWGATTHDDARAEVIVLDTDRQGRW